MPKRIYIRESQFNVLLENEGTNMKRARRYLEAQGLLDSGEEPENIFDVFDEDREGFALVGLNDKYNFINEKRQLLSGKWFDYAMYFSEGLAAVELNEKWNFIDTNGNFLLDKWVDGVESFKEGFAVIKVNDKANYINTNGQLLSSQWFDDVVEFSEGFGAVILNNKHNFINKEGRLLSKTWFDCSVFYFSGGFAAVELNRRWNFINTKGEFLSDQWWQSVRNFKEGFAAVYLNGKWNFIDTNGKLLSNEWFNYANDFDDGIATVRMLNGTFVNIDRQGRIYRNVSESIDERGTNLSSLYHFTDVMGLEGIMRSGVFNLSSSQRDIRNGKNYFSFTRHKSPLEGFAVPNRCNVRVEVNPDVINSIHDKSIDSFEYYSPSNAKVNPYCNIWSNIYSDNGDNSAKAGYRTFKASAKDAYDEEDAEYGNQAEEHLTSDKMQINAEKAIERIDIYVDTDNNYCTAHKEKIYNTFLGIFRMKNSPLYDKIFIYDNKRDFSLQTNNCVPMREYSIKKLMMDLGVGGAKLSVAESRNRNKILKTSGNMKKVFITEQQLKYILNESVKKVFKEGQFDFLDDDEFKWSNDYSVYVVVDDSCDAITGNYDNVQDAINDAKESARSGGSYSVFGCVNDVYDDNTLVYCTSGDRNSYKF